MTDGLFQCVELPSRGRALITTKNVRAGEIVLQDSPSIIYVDSSCALRFCSSCLRLCPDPSSACSGCSFAIFCSNGCKASHTNNLCKAFTKLAEARFDSEMENQARFLLAVNHLALVDKSEFERIMLLEGEGKLSAAVYKLHTFVEQTIRACEWSSSFHGLAVNVTADLLLKESQNGFGLMAPSEIAGQRSVRGYGLYPTASFINHECLPNCCRFDYIDNAGSSNTDIFIRAMHDIEPGTEITISYFPINWPYDVRQDRLWDEYGFKCVCKRCMVEKDWSDEESDEEEDDEDDEEGEDQEKKMPNGIGDKIIEETLQASSVSSKQEEEVKEEEEGEEGENGESDDFEHAMYFVKYLCPKEDCGGTMAPIPPNSDGKSDQEAEVDAEVFLTMECNMCVHLRTGDEFRKDLADHMILG